MKNYIEQQNKAAVAADPSTNHVVLEIGKVANEVIEIALKNRGNRNLRVVRPLWGYSIEFHFFDGAGRECIVENRIARSLPLLSSNDIVTLSVNDELSTRLSKEVLEKYLRVPGDCRFVVASYLPSEFALIEFDKNSIDLRTIRVWSNPMGW